MKIKFDRNEMLNTIAPAMGFVSSKNTIAAIEGIYLNANKDTQHLTVCGYDLEKGIRLIVDCNVEEDGHTIVGAGKFNQILRLMPAGEITLEVNDKNSAKIYAGKSEFEISTLPGKDYPALPELSGEKGFGISQKILKKMVNQTSFAVAVNDTRNALNSAYFEIKGNHIKVVGCDGFRLAIRENDTDMENHNLNEEELDFSFMIPGKSLMEMMKLIEDKEETVKIVFGRKHIIFCMDDRKFFARMTDGEYVNYQRLLQVNHPTHAVLDCDALIDALERAALITDERGMGQVRSVVKLRFEDELLKVSSSSVAGRVYDEIAAEKTGNDVEIGFNCRPLLDTIRACGVAKIHISVQNATSSMVIQPAEDEENEDFFSLILPVHQK